MLKLNLNNVYTLPAATTYPIQITAPYMDDYAPAATPTLYTKTEDVDEGGNIYTIPNRDALYQLILHLSAQLTKHLTYRFTKGLNSPCDDETQDINLCTELISVLSNLDA